MKRFYCGNADITGSYIYIKDIKELHHIKDVLRMKVNDKVVVFNDKGYEYEGSIHKINPDFAAVKIQKIKTAATRDNKINIAIACAVPKNSKMDDIIDKLTQLGANRIIPLLTEHTVVRWNNEQKEKHHQRWQKIALSASKQSQRSSLPIVEPVREIGEVFSKAGDFDLKLIPTLGASRKPLKDVFIRSDYKEILILIGPEGDFSAHEVELAVQKGFIPVSLGDLVLRVETAAIAVMSFIKLYLSR